MSENIGNLYVRAESEEEVSTVNSSPRKSTSLSSLRSLRDTFKRSESRTSQTSLASTSKIETSDNGSDTTSIDTKLSEYKICPFYFSQSGYVIKRTNCYFFFEFVT